MAKVKAHFPAELLRFLVELCKQFSETVYFHFDKDSFSLSSEYEEFYLEFTIHKDDLKDYVKVKDDLIDESKVYECYYGFFSMELEVDKLLRGFSLPKGETVEITKGLQDSVLWFRIFNRGHAKEVKFTAGKQLPAREEIPLFYLPKPKECLATVRMPASELEEYCALYSMTGDKVIVELLDHQVIFNGGATSIDNIMKKVPKSGRHPDHHVAYNGSVRTTVDLKGPDNAIKVDKRCKPRVYMHWAMDRLARVVPLAAQWCEEVTIECYKEEHDENDDELVHAGAKFLYYGGSGMLTLDVGLELDDV